MTRDRTEYRRKWNAEHREQRKKYSAEYRAQHREAPRMRTYGLSRDEAIRLGGITVCFACGETDLAGHNHHIDHDYGSGLVRGILCAGCNMALGLMHDSPWRLRALADYVDSWKPVSPECGD